MMKIGYIFTVPSGSKRLSAMEGLRAYAAGIVYILHLVGTFFSNRLDIDFDKLSVFQLAEINTSYLPFYWLFRSHYGVDIFFLLSGYLIAGLVCKANFHYPLFLYHRFLRIYPTLIVSTLSYVIYSVYFSNSTFWLGGILGNLLLLNGIPGSDFPAINVPTWSLFFEFVFYFTFPILWKMCKGNLSMVILCSIVLIGPFVFLNQSYIRFSMFMGGVVLKVLSESQTSKIRAYITEGWVIILYMLSTAVFVFTKSWLIFIPLYIFPAMLLVDRALNSSGRLTQLLSLKPLRYFGNISFSFYLFHLLAIKISTSFLKDFNIQNDYYYFFCFLLSSFSVAFIFSILCFTFVEKQYFKNKVNFDKFFTRITGVTPLKSSLNQK